MAILDEDGKLSQDSEHEFDCILTKYSLLAISSLEDELKPLSNEQRIPGILPSDFIGHQGLSDRAVENHKRLRIGFRADNASSFFHHSSKVTDSVSFPMLWYRTPGDRYPRS
ncbi:unnamed protein product [Rodentolepis nana]|uniref:Uncharacterized protein n=1 Tax=Rodentolepis nana TaxID=102285 RepID=A0A0R3T465_RODNA|nr:unnamed protein product [Rodentolepis nana]